MDRVYRCWILHVGLLVSTAGYAWGADIAPAALDTSVRAATRDARTLIETAVARSPTVVRLIRALDETDVIAYVQLSIPPHVDTALTAFAAATPQRRFLRILINARTPPWEQVQLLAHELQHVLEIAGAPEVRSDAGMRQLYGRIGRPGGKPDQFETTEAQQVQAIVRREYATSVASSAARSKSRPR